MSLDTALRLTEVLLALALIQQSLEHLVGPRAERILFGLRAVLCGLVLVNLGGVLPLVLLAALSLFVLHRFQGPYNGGSDRMGLLVLWCLTLAQLAPTTAWREIAFGYLGAQLVLSYFISGWVKVVNPEWRSGQALRDVFQFSAYPVSEGLRGWAGRPRLLHAMSWAVIAFELAFPLALATPWSLYAALAMAACFHLANACLFGLNRFFWTWLSAYPAIVWLQDRLL
jgi:hypothetical protein